MRKDRQPDTAMAPTGVTAVTPVLDRPLYVDMDGTLLATDLLWELIVLLIKINPALLLRAPFWLLKGKAFFKQQLASHLPLDAALLPYNESVIAFLARERRRGRHIILATASDRLAAERVARHVGVFSDVLASDGRSNLAGRVKLSAILRHADGMAFDYIGNSLTDLPICQKASTAFLVRPSRRTLSEVGRTSNVGEVLAFRPPALRALLRTLRVHQWAKNALLIVPLLLAHKILDLDRLLQALFAFLAFSLAASAVYILNDLLDLSSDRRHPDKRFRPLAAGLLPIPVAFAMLPLALMAAGAIATVLLPASFTAILLLYLVTTTAYSVALKRIAILDVLVLAGLYTMRVLAGAVATQVPVSPWFLAFSMFFFLSLAFVKRYAELRLPRADGDKQEYLLARGYLVGDADLLRSTGAASGYLAVAVFAFYINSPEVHTLYSRPTVLWLIGPLLLYWISRVWFLAHRGCLHSDPVVFALTDRASYVLAALVAALLLGASLT
jgi:4-hydroxybenzoate polyprenyltransferase/phosphoserine phosphatase